MEDIRASQQLKNLFTSKHMFVTYALFSPVYDKIYIGFTSDLIDRYNSHNFLSTKGFTKNFRPWIVVYVEFHESKPAAMKREKELKSSRGRDFVRKQIELLGLKSVS
jgi:putative endonuclease